MHLSERIEKEGIGSPASNKPIILDMLEKAEPPPVCSIRSMKICFILSWLQQCRSPSRMAWLLRLPASSTSSSAFRRWPICRIQTLKAMVCSSLFFIAETNPLLHIDVIPRLEAHMRVVATMVESSWVGLHATLTLLLRQSTTSASTGSDWKLYISALRNSSFSIVSFRIFIPFMMFLFRAHTAVTAVHDKDLWRSAKAECAWCVSSCNLHIMCSRWIHANNPRPT